MVVDTLGAYLLSDAIVDDIERVMQDLREQKSVVTPALVERVRNSIGKGQVDTTRLIIELATGTLRAERLGKRPNRWLFTNQMAEQSTHPDIAAHHAAAFAGCEHVLEICTGAGLDTHALACVATQVTTYEADPIIHACTRGNILRGGFTNVTCINQPWPPAEYNGTPDGVWADPSRREERTRKRTGTAYEPPLSTIPKAPIVGIKVGPGDIVDASGYTSEYIGYGRECRERILWQGRPETQTMVTLVDQRIGYEVQGTGYQVQGTGYEVRGTGYEVRATGYEVRGTGYEVRGTGYEVLVEPHNALIASGLLTQFFAEHNMRPLDPRIGYGLTDQQPPASPWYTAYNILHMEDGASERRMQERIYEYGWGRDTIIKKRGWDKDPESVRSRLTFVEGGQPGVILVARVGEGHVTVYGNRVASAE